MPFCCANCRKFFVKLPATLVFSAGLHFAYLFNRVIKWRMSHEYCSTHCRNITPLSSGFGCPDG
ncbi:hypothetical protein FCN45_01080 [Pantoea sp. SO10]|nr:hypothetical protein FCN45_01080 [Pantoea sp. SO10]